MPKLQKRTCDSLGQKLSPSMVEVFQASANLHYLSEWLHNLALKLAPPGPEPKRGYELIEYEKVTACWQWLKDHLRQNRPFAQCLDCKMRGSVEVGCVCNGRGWLSEEEYREWLRQSPASKLSTIEKLLSEWGSSSRSTSRGRG